ncbi:Ger(x)C family spore germination C-terminal domain-containing protein [Neobacillus pocheonensis]|uniref:Ger(x)C family spore germination C-terminal domain-containing protein n=1 Tax=Neobacillus pocheonensis TaxID=363869 RepID=UPI003D2E7260
MEEHTVRTPLALYDNQKKITALLPCENPNVKVTPELREKGDPVYNLHIKVHATVTQLNVQMTTKQLKAEATAKIEDEIRSTFATGMENNVDVYHLEEKMFRSRYADWKQLTRKNAFPLTNKSLGNIQMEVEIRD